ncbi:MAG: hypothetical protein ACXW6R_26730 [Candidatus Binatia bacterium]
MNCWNWVACPRWKIVNRLNRTYTLLLRSILNIKVTVGGDDGQIERTVPLAAPLRSRSVIVPRDGDMDYRIALLEAVRTAQHRGADNDPSQD